MKKTFYISTIACCMLALTGCVQSQKRVATPSSGMQGPNMSAPVYTGDGTTDTPGAKTVQQPGYLDIADESGLTLEDVTREQVLPSMQYVNDRIYQYSSKLEKWKELDSKSMQVDLSQDDTEQMVRCFRKLQGVLNGYTALREDLLQNHNYTGNGGVSGTVIQDLQIQDIEFLESPCGKLLGDSTQNSIGWGQSQDNTGLEQLEALVKRYADNHEYEEVVQVWLQIPENQKDRLNQQTKLRYGNALMYLHQEGQAAKIYRQVIDEMSAAGSNGSDLVSYRKTLADLYTASGNYKAAEEQYNKISEAYISLGKIDDWSKLQISILEGSVKGGPELKAYSGLLRNYLGFIPEKDGYKVVWQADEFLLNYPYSAVSSNVDIIKADSQKRADGWVNRLIANVDQLVAEKKYDQAIRTIDSVPLDLIDNQKRDQLRLKKDDLVLADAVNRETLKLTQVQDLQRKWNNGMLLVKGERYEEAITLFTEMLDTEYGAKAESKISEVALLAANSERRKAADLFIRFTKTSDQESQKKLLLECHRKLKDILVKYPDVEIADKVRSNIKRVEQEMNRLDPNLLRMTENDFQFQSRQTIDPFNSGLGVGTLQPSAQSPITERPLVQ
ncbi:tetratricopeptide repeat protein [Desulfosediminicola sp.]|uniref:tetratricopeptide repeat protein n=1 Tax=Desulfosediminicola sp. TaxID=2886825 RepID=UPI003AF2E5AB